MLAITAKSAAQKKYALKNGITMHTNISNTVQHAAKK